MDYTEVINFIRSRFPEKDFIPLHEPRFSGNERKYILDAIDSTFVSSVGAYVSKFEEMIAAIAGTKYAIATVNGTSALHMALIVSGVKRSDLVISQSLTFIATCNAISYIGASPAFVDVDTDTMGMSPIALEKWLFENTEIRINPESGQSGSYHKTSNQRIAAVVPMHTFGHPCRIDEIAEICANYHIPMVEDAAESLGSYYKGRHTGSFGLFGTFSFNGNKTVTCGGGGALVTNDAELAAKAKHLTTQAKVPHQWEFNHDEIGYNYRMPNLNAAFACAQLEQLIDFVENKRALASDYTLFFDNFTGIDFKKEPAGSKSNYWLNAIEVENKEMREAFLAATNENGIMTRPAWTLMHKLPMFDSCFRGDLQNSEYLSDRLINIPSSVR
jgi:aminotransferase in exopolysaccharide biosynthesis